MMLALKTAILAALLGLVNLLFPVDPVDDHRKAEAMLLVHNAVVL